MESGVLHVVGDTQAAACSEPQDGGVFPGT